MSSTTFFIFFIPLLAIILLAINLIFAPHNPYLEKKSPFECGFHSFLGQNRTQFSISFFIFALLFLLFDLEILLIYPYAVSSYSNGIYGLSIMLIFFLALTLGFAFELGKNALKIDSRQMLTLINKKFSLTSQTQGLNKINKILSKLFGFFLVILDTIILSPGSCVLFFIGLFALYSISAQVLFILAQLEVTGLFSAPVPQPEVTALFSVEEPETDVNILLSNQPKPPVEEQPPVEQPPVEQPPAVPIGGILITTEIDITYSDAP